MRKVIVTAALSLALLVGVAPGASAVTESTPTASALAAAATTLSPATVVLKTKKIRLKVGTAKTITIKVRAATVADVLAQRQITLSATDRVKPALTAKVRKGMKIVVRRVTISTVTLTEVVAPPVIKKANPNLKRGVTNVLVPGVAGSAERTYTVTTVNGKVSKKVLVSENVLLAPNAQVVEVGTKGKPLNLARLKMWNKISRCESGGRWHINTGNGYYGGLQFALGTWRAYGGRDFAKYPHKASKAEQITVANRVYKKRGTRPWGCA